MPYDPASRMNPAPPQSPGCGPSHGPGSSQPSGASSTDVGPAYPPSSQSQSLGSNSYGGNNGFDRSSIIGAMNGDVAIHNRYLDQQQQWMGIMTSK